MIPLDIDEQKESQNHQTTPNTRSRNKSIMSNSRYESDIEPSAKRQNFCIDSSDINTYRTTQVSTATLFTDGLHIIFTFLNDKDWKRSHVWQVNHQWRISAMNMKSCGFGGMTLTTSNPTTIQNFLSSSLRHHVSDVESCPDDLYGADAILPMISQMSWINRLTLTYDRHAYTMDLEPLSTLQRLQHLTLTDMGISNTQLSVIKQLPSLLTLKVCDSTYFSYFEHCHEWSISELHALCSPPHQLQRLEYISLGHTYLNAEMCQLLANLPALTELTPGSLRTPSNWIVYH